MEAPWRLSPSKPLREAAFGSLSRKVTMEWCRGSCPESKFTTAQCLDPPRPLGAYDRPLRGVRGSTYILGFYSDFINCLLRSYRIEGFWGLPRTSEDFLGLPRKTGSHLLATIALTAHSYFPGIPGIHARTHAGTPC